MIAVREIPLPEDGRRLLEGFAAAAPARANTFWQELKASAALDRKFLEDRAAGARAALVRGVCDEVLVRHMMPPAVSEHEHGILVFCYATHDRSLLLDISSVADDPRWTLHRVGGLMRAGWRWLRFKDLEGPWCFISQGPAIAPEPLPYFHGTALERRLTEEMEWPGDDAVLPFPLAEVARLAAQNGA